MNATTAVIQLIEETPRGPSIAGTRITVYSVMDYLEGDLDRDFVKRVMVITDEQLDAVLEYIAQHKEEVERDYQRILRRSEELRARYKKIQLERSPFPPDMPEEEKRASMRQRIAELKQTAQPNNDNHDTSGPRP
ncbi:MAG TPA: DUF433 domain-containing protein [Blastocatellia bacterium]|nr:DUF433 domain-containing protein [Blastocatellia bacterium]